MVISYTAYCFESNEDEVYGSGYLGEANMNPSPVVLPVENVTSNVTVPGSESSTVIGGLDPYKRYACFVTASTSVGEGEPSYAVSAVTDESSKWTTLHPICRVSFRKFLKGGGAKQEFVEFRSSEIDSDII